MTAQTPKPKNDSSDETVIGFEGSDLHHDLKDKQGEQNDADHAAQSDAADPKIAKAVEGSDAEGAVSDALKDAVK